MEYSFKYSKRVCLTSAIGLGTTLMTFTKIFLNKFVQFLEKTTKKILARKAKKEFRIKD